MPIIVTSICGVLALAALTGLGARRRGTGALGACVAGLAFPITWAVWYVRDEVPYHRSTRVSPAPAPPGRR